MGVVLLRASCSQGLKRDDYNTEERGGGHWGWGGGLFLRGPFCLRAGVRGWLFCLYAALVVGEGKGYSDWLGGDVTSDHPPWGVNEDHRSNFAKVYLNLYERLLPGSADVTLLYLHFSSTSEHRLRW